MKKIVLLCTVCALISCQKPKKKDSQINKQDVALVQKVKTTNTNEEKKGKETNPTNDLNPKVLDYIKNHYKKQFPNLVVKETRSEDILEVKYSKLQVYDKDSTLMTMMTVSIPLSKNSASVHKGDLNGDKTKDLIVTVNTSGGGEGGNVWWDDIFVFTNKNNTYNCVVQKSNWDLKITGCKTNGYISIVSIKDNIIMANSSCYGKKDPRCCPSIKKQVKLKLNNNILEIIKK